MVKYIMYSDTFLFTLVNTFDVQSSCITLYFWTRWSWALLIWHLFRTSL